MAEQEQPLSFQEVESAFSMAKRDPFFAGMTIQDFSRFMNKNLGKPLYSAGDVGKFGATVKRVSRQIDTDLEPVSKALGGAGADIGALIGPRSERVGRAIGESLPRSAVDVGLFAGGAAMGAAGIPLMGAGLSSVAAKTYEETGSPVASAISAAALPLTAGAMHAVRGPVARLASKPVGEMVERALGPGVAKAAERAIEYGGASLSALVTQEAASEAVSKVATGEFYNPLDPERLGYTIGSTLPFMGLDLPPLIRGYKMQSGQLKPASFADLFARGELPGATRSYAQHLRDVIGYKNLVKSTRTEAQRAPSISETTHRANQPQVQVPDVPDATLSKDKVAAETKAAMQNTSPAAAELPGLKTPQDFVGWSAHHGMSAKQTWKVMPDEVKAKVPGVNEKERIEWLKQERNLLLMGQKDLFDATSQKFTEDQLSGGLYGSIAVEQLGQAQPFGYKVASDGTVPVDGVRRGMGKLLTKEELAIYSEAGLEEFLKSKGHKVGVQEMQKWLMDNGPQVEVRKYEAGRETAPNKQVQRFIDLEHELETHGFRVGGLAFDDEVGVQAPPNSNISWSTYERAGKKFWVSDDGKIHNPHRVTIRPEEEALLLERASLWGTYTEASEAGQITHGSQAATARFTTVNPKPLDQMPGAVDILVKVPRRKMIAGKGELKGKVFAEETPKFSESSHFPNDANVLGFARGYMETLEDGTKVFHVFEVQSDWAQRRRRDEAESMRRGVTMDYATSDDPLLRNWERLVLKSAIKHALDNGAHRIAISDADTAMLTEGHDRYTQPKVVKTSPTELTREQADAWLSDERVQTKNPSLEVRPADKASATSLGSGKIFWDMVDRSVQEIKQEKGMRLHYDQTVPNILKDLTGYEGVRMEFGEHQNVFEQRQGEFPPEGARNVVDESGMFVRHSWQDTRKDLLLKNPDGTPKTTISARVYGLDKAREELLRRGGYTFFGKDKLLPLLQRMDKLGISDEQKAQALLRLQNVAIKPGEDLYDVAMRMAKIDKSLFSTNEPDALMNGVNKFFRWLFWAHGETPQRIDSLTRRALYVAARFGPLAGRFKVLLASEGNPFTVRPNRELYDGAIGLKRLRTGLSKPDAIFESLWTLAHESFHGWEYSVDSNTPETSSVHREAMDKMYVAASQLTPAERRAAVASLLQMVTGGGERFRNLDITNLGRYGDEVVGPQEFLADLAGIIAIGADNPRNMADLIRFGDYDMARYADGFYKDMASVFGVVEPALEKVMKFTSGDAAKGGVKQVRSIVENLQQLLVAKDEADRSVEAFLGMMERQEATPFSEPPILNYKQIQNAQQIHRDLRDAFTTLVGKPWEGDAAFKDVIEEADDLMLPKNKPSLFGDRINFWDRFKPIAQLVKKFPVLKETFNLAMSYMGISTNNTLALWNSFVDVNGKVDLKRLRRISTDGSSLNNAIREVALVQNAAERVLPRAEREQRAPAYARLSKQEKDEIDLSLSQFGDIAVKAAIQRVRAFRTRVELATGRVIQSHNRDLSVDQAIALGQKVASSVFDKETLPPDQYAALLAEIQAIPISPKAMESAIAVASSNEGAFANVKKHLLGDDGQGKPWYMPEVRVRDWHIAWKELNGTPQLWDFRTQAEAAKKLRELEAKQAAGELEYLKAYNRQDKMAGNRGAVKEEILQLYADAEKKLYDSTLAHLDKENPLYEDLVTELRSEYQPGDAAAALMTSPYMMERQFVGGRERLNFVEGMVHYIDATSHGISKQFVKQKQALVLNDPALRQHPNLRNVAKDYLGFVTDPQGKEFTALKNLVFFNYLGFNPSSLMVEGTQQFLTLVPHLVREGASVGGAYKLMTGAWHKMAKAALTAQKKGVRLFDVNNQVFDDVELDAAVKEAVSNRDIDTGIIQDLYAEQDVDFINTRNILSGKGTELEYRQLLSKPLHAMFGAARHLYGSMTRMNSLSAFVASFDHARSQGLKGQEAYQFAIDSVRTTMFGGGRITRPLAAQQLGSATGVGGVLYTLQSYTFSMLAMMSRLTREAITKQLSGPERTAALKAAGLMWGTQAVMGGVMGLPMVAASVALLEQFFPEAEVRKGLRSAFVGLAGDDEEMGHMVADAAMGGVGNLTPVDFASRFQLGNLFGISPYDGFSWKNLVGPSASLAESYAKGLSSAAQGKFEQAAETLAPSGARNLVKLLTDGGAVRDAQERLVFEPTAVESVFMGLGFKPKRLQQHYEQQAISVRSERIAQQDTQDFYQDMAKLLMAGENQAVRDTLYERQRTHPGFNVVTGSRRIAELVQEMMTPADLSRTGSRSNAASGQQTARLYPRVAQPPETSRVLQRSQLERTLGIPGTGRPDKASLQVASMVDRVLAANPTLTRVQALALVERMLHPKTYQRSYGSN